MIDLWIGDHNCIQNRYFPSLCPQIVELFIYTFQVFMAYLIVIPGICLIYMPKPEGCRPDGAGIYQANPDWPWYKCYIPLRHTHWKSSPFILYKGIWTSIVGLKRGHKRIYYVTVYYTASFVKMRLWVSVVSLLW